MSHTKAHVDRKIYTHFNVDLDAAASVWATRQFVPGFAKADVCFVPANWQGNELTDADMAVDIPAGGRGLKGELGPLGTQFSCFASLIAKYASPEDRGCLAPLVEFVDAQDAYGSAVKHLAPDLDAQAQDVFASTGLNAVLRALQAAHPRNDPVVVARFGDILTGMLKARRARIRAVAEADAADRIGPNGEVAIVSNAHEFATNGVLFERGVRAIVYIDGHNLGVIREGTESVRMDDPIIRSVVQAAGEEADWFAHPAGFLFCRGSRKAPAQNPSAVNHELLAEALLQVLLDS